MDLTDTGAFQHQQAGEGKMLQCAVHSLTRTGCRASLASKGHTPALGACREGVRHFAAPFPGIADDANFISEATLRKDAGAISILRMITEDGKLLPGAKLPFSQDEGLSMFRT